MINKPSRSLELTPVVLALDCATSGCSVCVWQDGKVLAVQRLEMSRGQAEVLMGMVDETLRAAGLKAKDINAIAVTHGPGAFTGLRIGLSAARGLALALNIPCVGVTTLEVLAHAIPTSQREGRTIVACVESKRADIYVQVFGPDLSPKCEPQAVAGPALQALLDGEEAVVLVGDAAERAQDMLAESSLTVHLSTGEPLPDPVILASLAVGRVDGAETPEPLYLRPPDAKLPKAQGRARA